MIFNAPLPSLITRAVILSSLMGLAGYALFPLLDSGEGQPQRLAALLAAAASFLTLLLGALQRAPRAADAGVEPISIFVGNLAYKAGREELTALFAPFGEVHSVRIMTDRATRRPRGFAFVEMEARAARKAIKRLNGREFLGRELKVDEGTQRRSADG